MRRRREIIYLLQSYTYSIYTILCPYHNNIKMNNDAATKKRIAVIGSGLAGLTAAHLLQRRCSNGQVIVHIFEKAQRIGMDSASIDVLGRDGKVHRVDSPMRAVQGGELLRPCNCARSWVVYLC
jgi:NADPH-dependent 2,4-dienoyl-CoA reductase/sulfur reductase-like enzyme